MLEFIQSLVLSDYLIILILMLVFGALSTWALRNLREYIGYALGCLVALFLIVVYSSIVSDPPAKTVDETLNFFQVVCSAGIGFFVGGITLAMLRLLQGLQGARTSMLVAFFTALNITLLFLMVVQGPVARRMIGIFALAFAIAALFALAILQGRARTQAQGFSAQGVPVPPSGQQLTEDALTPGQPPQSGSRLDDIRRRMQDNNNQL